MKKTNVIIAILSILFLISCSKNDNESGRIDSVTNVTASPFIGSVKLSWTAPSSDDYYYTSIAYKDSDGNVTHEKVCRYDAVQGIDSTVIGGFSDTNVHDFLLTAHGFSGAVSSEVKISGTPEGLSAAKDYVMGTVKVVPAAQAALVSWTNKSGVAVNLIATYKDMNNVDKTDTVDAKESGTVELEGLVKTTDITIIAQNVKDAATTSKVFSVTPNVDPDDIIYDDIEYFTLQSGVQFNVSHDNPYNPLYEYTIVTTGGDPHSYIYPLKASRAGTILKFRYKATQDFDLELFWANAGGGAAGGRSTVVTVPAASTWTTFTHDYTDAMSKYSWSGNVGDFFRMDWGGTSGVTIHIRNIHLE
jgi:hypothetical protein